MAAVTGKNIMLYYTESNRKYYFNGVNQGVIGGNQFYELSPTSVPIGAYSRYNDGLITSFITDAGDPSQLVIKSGVWTFQNYFEITFSIDYNPYIYYKIYKYNGTTFTLIGTSNQSPLTTTSKILYTTTFNCPETTLTANDRIAVEVWGVNIQGRDVTLTTSGTNIGSVVTTLKGLDIPFACSTNATFNVQVDQKEVTSQTSAWYREFKNDIASWSVTCDGLITLSGYGYLFLLKQQQSREQIFIKFVIDNGVDGLVIISGNCNLTDLSINAPYKEVGTYSVSLQGSGAYGTSGTNINQGGTVIVGGSTSSKGFTAAGGETTITWSDMVGKELLYVSRGGIDVQDIISIGTPVNEQVKWVSASAVLTFSRALESGEYVRALLQ